VGDETNGPEPSGELTQQKRVARYGIQGLDAPVGHDGQLAESDEIELGGILRRTQGGQCPHHAEGENKKRQKTFHEMRRQSSWATGREAGR
jgi:hypothetical protein